MPHRLRVLARMTGATAETGLRFLWSDLLERAGRSRRDEFPTHLPGWAKGMLRWSGVQPVVTPGSPPAARGARLVIANHRSPVDIPILLSIFGGYVVSRADVAGWPLVGAAARRAGTLFVDRADRMSGARAIRALRRRLQRGATVILFPEGTTRAGDEVAPFREGAFLAARGVDVEIFPVGLAYPPGCEWFGGTFGAHMATIARRPRTLVSVRIGVPFRSGPGEEIAARAHGEVQALTHEARRVLDAAPPGGAAPR